MSSIGYEISHPQMEIKAEEEIISDDNKRVTRTFSERVQTLLHPISLFTISGTITSVTFLVGAQNISYAAIYIFITTIFHFRSYSNIISATLFSYALLGANEVFQIFVQQNPFTFNAHFIGVGFYSALLILIIRSLKIERTRDEVWEQKKTEKHTGALSQESSLVKISEVVFLQTIITIMQDLSSNINNLTSENANRLRQQIGQSHEILHSTQELTDFYTDVDRNVAIIRNMSEKAIESAMLGQKMAIDTETEIQNVLKTMRNTTSLIQELSESTIKISEIIKGIENIADQTNLLALNATIESARSGESGHSFAVVAEEIGKLAETTQKSTRNVIDMIDSIRISTNVAMDMVPKEAAQAENIIEFSGRVNNQLQNVLGGVEYMTDQIHELALNSRKQAAQSNQINQGVHTIAGYISENSEGVRHIFDYVDAMEEETTNLTAITERFDFDSRVENPTQKFIEMAEEFLAECEQTFDEGIAEGHTTLENLFDRKYHPIAGFDPPKYHSAYDRYTDEYIGPIQEKYLAKDHRLEYFTLVDSNGYVPTHNKKYAQRLTANKEYNLSYNRTKRMFDDPIGLKAAKNQEKYILQMYKKDTGEYINDIAIPFFFHDQHWGALRIGFVF